MEAETFKHIHQVAKYLAIFSCELIKRAIGHDASKLQNPEGPIFDKFTPRLKGSTYGSDEYKEFLKEMKPALDHHYANNRHHPEHHSDGIRGMTLIDLMEMVADCKAASERHTNGDIFRSLEINQKRFGYSDELKQIFINTVTELIALSK